MIPLAPSTDIPRFWTDERDEQLASLRRQRFTFRYIGRMMGCSETSARDRFKRLPKHKPHLVRWMRFEVPAKRVRPAQRPDMSDSSTPKFSSDYTHLYAVLAAQPRGFPFYVRVPL